LGLLLAYFVKEFSPPDPDDKSLEILLDIVGMGLGAGLAPFFNNCQFHGPLMVQDTFQLYLY
jgi:hypothetical protein